MPLFPSKVTAENDRAYLSWRWLSTCLPVRNDELIPSFVLGVCMAFVLPLKPWIYFSSHLFISTHGFLCLSYSLPILLRESEKLAL